MNSPLSCREGGARVSCHAHPRKAATRNTICRPLLLAAVARHYKTSADIGRRHLYLVLPLQHTFLHRLGAVNRNDSSSEGAPPCCFASPVTGGISNGVLVNLGNDMQEYTQCCEVTLCSTLPRALHVFIHGQHLSHTFPRSRRKRGRYRNFLLENLPAAVLQH